MSDINGILDAIEGGDSEDRDELFGFLYQDLRHGSSRLGFPLLGPAQETKSLWRAAAN